MHRAPQNRDEAADRPESETDESVAAPANDAVNLLQTHVDRQVSTAEKGMMLPPGEPFPDADPPALLLTAGQQCLTKDGQEHHVDAQPAVQPAYLRQAFFDNERVDLFSWGGGRASGSGSLHHFRSARRSPDHTLPNLVEAAITGAPFRVDRDTSLDAHGAGLSTASVSAETCSRTTRIFPGPLGPPCGKHCAAYCQSPAGGNHGVGGAPIGSGC